MKNIIIVSAIVMSSLFIAGNALAQQPKIGCVDKMIVQRAEVAKASFTKQGMKVYKSAMISMTDQESFPIEVQLDKGKTYQILFIGDEESQKITAELYGNKNKMIERKKLSQGDEPGYISFNFSPEKTDIYLLMVTQKQKHNRNMCGNVTILEEKTTK